MNPCSYDKEMDQHSKKKVVLVSGGAGGIGSAISKRFLAQGFHVAIHYYQHEARARKLAEELNLLNMGRAEIYQANLAHRQEVESMIQKVYRDFGHIDVLINNAGIAQQKLFTEITDEDWENMFDVNVKGIFHCCQTVLPVMIKRQKGKIVNISSMWGLTGASCEVHYSAAKAAVIGFTKALAKEVGPSHIQVNCVAPGLIATDMNKELTTTDVNSLIEDTPLCRVGVVEDVANAVWFLASEQASFITGQILNVDGGFVI